MAAKRLVRRQPPEPLVVPLAATDGVTHEDDALALAPFDGWGSGLRIPLAQRRTTFGLLWIDRPEEGAVTSTTVDLASSFASLLVAGELARSRRGLP